MFNNNSGRMRHSIEIYEHPSGSDEFGIPYEPVLLFTKRCDVEVKSGDKLSEYGTVLTSSVITVLMRYDSRIQYDHVIVWGADQYEIMHIRPDERKRDMVMTCEVKTK